MKKYFIKELSTGAVSETVQLPLSFAEDLARSLWNSDFILCEVIN